MSQVVEILPPGRRGLVCLTWLRPRNAWSQVKLDIDLVFGEHVSVFVIVYLVYSMVRY